LIKNLKIATNAFCRFNPVKKRNMDDKERALQRVREHRRKLRAFHHPKNFQARVLAANRIRWAKRGRENLKKRNARLNKILEVEKLKQSKSDNKTSGE